MLLCLSRGSDDIQVAAFLGWGVVSRTGLLLVCGQDRDGPLEMERASSYQVTLSRSGRGPGTAGESFAGQQVRGSRISGQAAPGAWVLPDGRGQLAAGLAGDVALEAADDLRLGLSFRCAALSGRRVRAHQSPGG